MSEIQQSIGEWGLRTFGPEREPYAQLLRLDEEICELTKEVYELQCMVTRRKVNPTPQEFEEIVKKIRQEIADIIIVAMNWGYQHDVDILDDVLAKMEVNEAREWEVRPDGTGQHK